MDIQLLTICVLTFIIHLVGTLAYSVRIAGIRTGRIAVSFAIFNILVLVSRTSNSFQGPFLAKRVESNLLHENSHNLLTDFRWFLLSATLATLAGAFITPTFQRLFSKAVSHFSVHRSVLRVLIGPFSISGFSAMKSSITLPARANLAIGTGLAVSARLLTLNAAAVALWTVGVFASLYAGYLHPNFRVTASTLSSLVNGGATILMFMLIDPQLSILTDDVVDGKLSESGFRRVVVWLVGSRCVGTLLAQVLLLPASWLIGYVAERF
jgi:general stress protein CsbA